MENIVLGFVAGFSTAILAVIGWIFWEVSADEREEELAEFLPEVWRHNTWNDYNP